MFVKGLFKQKKEEEKKGQGQILVVNILHSFSF